MCYWDVIYSLAGDKYKSWDWTFGRTPDFVLSHDIKYDSDQFECVLHVKHEVIMEISVQDRTLSGTTFEGLKSKFIGQRYDCIWPFLSFRA